ncbi:MAG: hypothetical protein M3R51_10695 [Candidatus Eremiobacteraeota bacterium]|nr:hypothetical protein [Candidatus Eremiobacteraeota bacterium]
MNGPLLAGIAAAAGAPTQSRAERATHVAHIVRDRRRYAWVGIYDVDENDNAILLGEAGSGPTGVRLSIPILGAESGSLMGTLDVEAGAERSGDDETFLDDCAAAMLPLYD